MKKKSYLYTIFNNYAMGFFIYFFSVGGFLVSRTGFLTVPMFGLMAGLYYKNIDISEILPKSPFFVKIKNNNETEVKEAEPSTSLHAYTG